MAGINVRNPKLYVMLLSDAVLMAVSLHLAYAFRFDFAVPPGYMRQIGLLLLLVLPVKEACLALLGLYRGMWRYTGLRDGARLLQAMVLGSLVVVAVLAFAGRFHDAPRSVFVLDCLFSFLLAGISRLAIRLLFLHRSGRQTSAVLPRFFHRRRGADSTRALIVGAGIAGEKILIEMLENPRLSCEAVGFVDDDPGKLGRTIHGVPVVGAVGDLGRYLDRYDVKHVFVTIGRVPSETMRGIVEACEDRGVPVKVLPGMGEIIGGEVSLKSMRDVEYGDLLGRESVHLDAENIRGYLTDHVVMVTGCGGSIGSELCRQIVRFNPRELVLLDAAEPGLFATEMQLRQKMKFSNCTAVLGSVADEGLMNRLFARHRPAVVLHAAAYKHVPMLEANPWAAVTNNVLGSLVVMRAAVSHGVGRFVLVSSDKAVRPSNVMGASKRVVELIMHSLSGNGTIFMAVRFGNVLGSSGSVVPIFMEQIRAGGPVTVTHRDASRYFMSIPEAAQLILQAGGIGTGGETFVLDMGKPVKIDAMARDLIRLCGSEPDSEIGIVYSGLRPGEKLHEELMTDGEGVAETMHKGILVLRQNGSPRYSAAELEREIDELRRLADGHDAAAIRAKFAEIVPEYAVQYSPSVL